MGITFEHMNNILAKNIRIIISNKSDKSMKSIHTSDDKDVNKTRINFLKKNNIDPNHTVLVRLKYEGDNYRRYYTVNDSFLGDGLTRKSTLISDAIVVLKPNFAVFLPLADCIGAVIYDPTKSILMVSHLGRHNLEQFGGAKSVEYLVKNYNVNPKNLKVWLSPAAGKESYPMFAFDNRSLHDVAQSQFLIAGVSYDNMEISLIDSAKDENYYSHSKYLKGLQADDGRFAIVALMTD